jgi:hypothetical protein
MSHDDEQRPAQPPAATDGAATAGADAEALTVAEAEPDPSPLSVIWTLFLDSGLSVGSYAVLRWLGESTYTALLTATIVAGIRAVYVIVRRREADAFALFMLFVFAMGLGLSFVTGSVDFLLVKESFGTGLVGLAFLITCLFGKPLMYYTSQRFAATTPDERARWQGLWQTTPSFRRHFRFMSIVWGVVFLGESLIRIPFVFLLPHDVMAVVSPLVTPVMITLLLVWTFRRAARYETQAKVGQ